MSEHDSRKTGLARALSKLGYCSRSQAAGLIRAGRVTVNGVTRRDPETPTRVDRDRIIVDLVELFEEEEEGQRQGEEPASARIRISREQAQAFAARATELMKAGRPLCPVCSGPMDPGGHICPRSNGHIVH